MILILQPNIPDDAPEYRDLMRRLGTFAAIETQVHHVQGTGQRLTEVYLVGDTKSLETDEMAALPGVERVVRISEAYRILGRHEDDTRSTGFEYRGIRFAQDTLHVFAGLCAVDSRENVDATFRLLREHGLACARMGAYKPRTSPYSFQGLGRSCLPFVFELAGKHGIEVIAMEVTHESHIDEIAGALGATGDATGVMLQVGTRNAQNFELLKLVGRQREFPVLLKRGFGITLEESLHAAEYLASEGNRNVVFALRGMKTNFGEPHRNLVDFGHIPVVKRLTRMPVCIDPSHSTGTRARTADGLLDIFHVTAQGVVAGANMVLVDFHPEPATALVDGPQALLPSELPHYLEDIRIARSAYEQRLRVAERLAG